MIKTINSAENLKGKIKVPGDKSISHRSVMLGSIANGTTHVSGFLTGDDCLSTIDCFRKMGIEFTARDFMALKSRMKPLMLETAAQHCAL